MNITTDSSVKTRLLGGLWGALVGDALGVPVEFTSRATLQANPVTTMREYGTHHQPRGTWSDDGSLLLCSADSLLTHEFNLGGDTDTTGCVAGGLAGVAYGVTALPPDWIGQLACKGDVDCLFHEFAELCESTGSKSGAR